MQQIVQELGSGRLSIRDVPDPMATPGQVVIANAASVISAGTERMARNLAKKSLLQKARERPDHVRRVLEKVRQEGLLETVRQVRSRLSEPAPLGYSSSGVVLACGDGVQGLRPGDRVASNGPHAGVVSVPKHLCALVPEGILHEQAAFTVISSIALQGVRLSQLVLGETAFVIGLGLVGQITVALLRAAGCRVIGTDLDADKCDLALKMGADVARALMKPVDVDELTAGFGADAVLVTAATSSSTPMIQAVEAVRKKGRVVLVGAVGMELERTPLYMKEAEVVVSCSYGPGRYDPLYEERGHDYPASHVRWTEQRNLQAVLDLMATGALDVSPLISHRFSVTDAHAAYDMIEGGTEPFLGIVLEYPGVDPKNRRREVRLHAPVPTSQESLGVGCIGAGNFATNILLPVIQRVGNRLRPELLCTARGLSAADKGERFDFARVTTDEENVFGDPRVGAVFLVTRHDLHGDQVVRALSARQHVFVEKPLALHLAEVERIDEALEALGDQAPILMVGFNRRFSPMALQVRRFFADVASPLTLSFRFNAGAMAPEEWTQDVAIGGGRIIGEACHAIDLMTFLADSPPVRVFAESIGGRHAPAVTDDQCFITLRHANGSVSSIGYLAGGDRAYPKERIEVFGGGQVGIIEDFREVTTVHNGRTQRTRSMQQVKGHQAEVEAFAHAVAGGGDAPIPWSHLRAVSLAAILAVRSLREGMPFEIPIATQQGC